MSDLRCCVVGLSDGERIYVDASREDVVRALQGSGLVQLGTFTVNPLQVTHIFVGDHPTILNPEKLEQEVSDGTVS